MMLEIGDFLLKDQRKRAWLMLLGAIPFVAVAYWINSFCATEPLCLVENGAAFDYHWFARGANAMIVILLLNLYFVTRKK